MPRRPEVGCALRRSHAARHHLPVRLRPRRSLRRDLPRGDRRDLPRGAGDRHRPRRPPSRRAGGGADAARARCRSCPPASISPSSTPRSEPSAARSPSGPATGRCSSAPTTACCDRPPTASAGLTEAVEISHSPLRLEPVSATFHGRDIFAPLAAHLAAGTTSPRPETPLALEELVTLELPVARREGDALIVHAVYVDRFGNVALNLGHGELAGSGLRLGHRLRLRFGGREHEAQYARTFADVPAGRLLVYEDAERRLAVALSSGDAAAALGIGPGDELRIDPA